MCQPEDRGHGALAWGTGVAGPGADLPVLPGAPSLHLFEPRRGEGTCLSENWGEGEELGSPELSGSQEGHRVCPCSFWKHANKGRNQHR